MTRPNPGKIAIFTPPKSPGPITVRLRLRSDDYWDLFVVFGTLSVWGFLVIRIIPLASIFASIMVMTTVARTMWRIKW